MHVLRVTKQQAHRMLGPKLCWWNCTDGKITKHHQTLAYKTECTKSMNEHTAGTFRVNPHTCKSKDWSLFASSVQLDMHQTHPCQVPNTKVDQLIRRRIFDSNAGKLKSTALVLHFHYHHHQDALHLHLVQRCSRQEQLKSKSTAQPHICTGRICNIPHRDKNHRSKHIAIMEAPLFVFAESSVFPPTTFRFIWLQSQQVAMQVGLSITRMAVGGFGLRSMMLRILLQSHSMQFTVWAYALPFALKVCKKRKWSLKKETD